jgi:hypothetical protein
MIQHLSVLHITRKHRNVQAKETDRKKNKGSQKNAEPLHTASEHNIKK